MAIPSDPSALRWLIGYELRSARQQARKTQADAARELGCTNVKINYMETGRNQQQPAEIDALLRFYGADAEATRRLVALAGRGDQGTWWTLYADALPDWFRRFVGLEGLARAMFTYSQMAFEGQLQTREYATALLVNNVRISPTDAAQVVRIRMARQRLVDDSPLRYHAVLEEAVLHRTVGGPTVMAAQLRHLLELAERDNVTLQVMPTATAVHDGLGGPFSILDFDEASSIGYVEYRGGAVYVQGVALETYELTVERLSEQALTDADSAALIRARIEALT